MVETKELIADRDWLIKACALMKKRYEEQSKLVKQNKQNLIDNEAIFINHVVMKRRFVISYIQPFHGCVDEMVFEELSPFVNPNQFKNGVLVVSKYPSTSLTNGSHFNGDAFEDTLNETNQNFPTINTIQILCEAKEFINCGTIFSASEIYALGKKSFHGMLGPLKKCFLSLSGLERLSISESRYMSSLITQVTKSAFEAVKDKLTILYCEPSKPLYVRMLLLCPQTIGEKNSVRILQIRDDDGRATKKSRACFEEGSYTASYDILKGLVVDNTTANKDVTSLKAIFCWPTSKNQMDSQPPHSSKSILQVQVALGEQQSPLNDIFLELTNLDSIANTTLNELSNSSDNSMSLEMTTMYENLSVFKETVSSFSLYNENKEEQSGKDGNIADEDEDDDLEKPMTQLLREKLVRRDHDFTDKLWMFLRNSHNGEEMKFYLEDVINDIVHGSLQPAISPINSTKLAKLVRKMYTEESEETKYPIKEKILEFLSNDASVVNLIVEIGFEKLRKDYYHYFLTNELTIASSMDKMRGKQQMGFNNHASSIAFLWKLHCCLEIVTTPTVYLSLDHDSQRSLLNAALDYYTQHKVQSTSPKFCLSLLPVHDTLANVLNSCTSRLPDHWKEGILRTNKAGIQESCIVSQSNSNNNAGDELTSASVTSTSEIDKDMKVGIVLNESVIELPQ
ncbi:uncharacterized protein [Clytia hemisphaerica]|uniref:Protein zwilch n=1 Tax=Clytia hemisphaerica TaxID=252671 RepID=A0A7M5XME4_9CNID